jgi:hypothetical protein
VTAAEEEAEKEEAVVVVEEEAFRLRSSLESIAGVHHGVSCPALDPDREWGRGRGCRERKRGREGG